MNFGETFAPKGGSYRRWQQNCGENQIADYIVQSKDFYWIEKASRKFMVQMFYRIQTSRDVNLSNIARSVNEEVRLAKLENRLPEDIRRRDFREEVSRSIIIQEAKRITEDTGNSKNHLPLKVGVLFSRKAFVPSF